MIELNRRANDDAQALPQWFRSDDNAYYCGLIARQVRARAGEMRAVGRWMTAEEIDAIAAILEDGNFQWRG